MTPTHVKTEDSVAKPPAPSLVSAPQNLRVNFVMKVRIVILIEILVKKNSLKALPNQNQTKTELLLLFQFSQRFYPRFLRNEFHFAEVYKVYYIGSQVKSINPDVHVKIASDPTQLSLRIRIIKFMAYSLICFYPNLDII